MKSRIIGTGSCLPAAKVTNDWLSTKMDTSDEWIVSRTGIRERRIARDETTTDMAELAAAFIGFETLGGEIPLETAEAAMTGFGYTLE